MISKYLVLISINQIIYTKTIIRDMDIHSIYQLDFCPKNFNYEIVIILKILNYYLIFLR